MPRGEDFLDWALQVLTTHAHNKSVLEIEFRGEEGTGIGPTLEFYSLVAAELQRKDLGMWVCDDEDTTDLQEDLGHGPKARGYYVKSGQHGLFPAPYPQDSPKLLKICSLFHLLGMFIGKSLQDQRLVDLPLALPFLKMLCRPGMGQQHTPADQTHEQETSDGEESTYLLKSESLSSLTEGELRFRCDSDAASDMSSVPGGLLEEGESSRAKSALTIEDIAIDTSSECSLGSLRASERQQLTPDRQQAWFSGLLDSSDFTITNPYLAKFLSSLQLLSEQRRSILGDESVSEADKTDRLEGLRLPGNARVEDLCLFYIFSPTSTVYGYREHELKHGGENIQLSLSNLDEYCDLTATFCLELGIKRQMEAFRIGFNCVFPLSHVRMFRPAELRLLVCGEMNPDWTRSVLVNCAVLDSGPIKISLLITCFAAKCSVLQTYRILQYK